MRVAVARRLVALDAEFYRSQAGSFSATRQAPWPGWSRCLELVGVPVAGWRLLDVACGNLRLARFLGDAWPGVPVTYDAVDACPELLGGWVAPSCWSLSYHQRDVVAPLLAGGEDAPRAEGAYDLVACFGFLHHVPTAGARELLLRQLIEVLAPGGTCCVSLWRFLDDEGLARRAEATTAAGLAELDLDPSELDPGDRLLGWQGRPHTYRYCHGFDDAEVDALVAAATAQGDVSLAGRFRSDGRTARLNEYLVFRRSSAARV